MLRNDTKIQKSEGNSTTLKNWIQKLEGKPTTLKNWIQKMEGNSTTPKNCVLTIFLHERSTIFFLVFSLVWFWIFVRNGYLFWAAHHMVSRIPNSEFSLIPNFRYSNLHARFSQQIGLWRFLRPISYFAGCRDQQSWQ